MKKNVFTYALFALLLICVMVSCNNSKTPEVIAKNPATLKVNYFREYYAVGDGPEKLVGTLSYTAEGGSSINTIDISSKDVNKEGFDTTVPAEGKTLKLTYKGIDCVVTYNVVKMESVDDLYGEFVVDDKTTLFFNGDNTVTKEKWSSWYQYYNDGITTDKETTTYTADISSSGRTIVKIDGTNYYPDGNGGILSYPSADQYFATESKYIPSIDYFYLSTGKEEDKSIVNDAARNKYLVMMFDYLGTAYIWFIDHINNVTDIQALDIDDAITVDAKYMTFGIGGVSMSKVTGTEPTTPTGANKNLTIMLNREGYDSKTRAFGLVSHSDTGYKGYSYTMKLSDVLIPVTP